MIKIYRGRLAQDNYLPQLKDLINIGDRVEPRGRTTREFINVVTEILVPMHHCIMIPERHWNPWLALSEFLWIMAGRNDIEALLPYNQNISTFSDDGLVLYGAYGTRIYEQIDPLIERLRKDPSDRRAVLSIWEPSDLTIPSKDPPCNNLVYFKLRNTKLDMTVINRSNDIHWGLYAVNIPTFGLLMEYIASRLGCNMGTQTHLSNSLHVYTDDSKAVEITSRMLQGYNRLPKEMPYNLQHAMAFNYFDIRENHSHWEHEDFAAASSAALVGETVHDRDPSFIKFASEFLKLYRERKEGNLFKLEQLSTEWPQYIDWIEAGIWFREAALHQAQTV